MAKGDRGNPGECVRWYNARMHFSFNWLLGAEDVIRLMIAYFIVFPVGWYREKEAHGVGVRTFPLVAMASCGYVLLASPAGHLSLDSQSRVIQGLVAGIGFIGGGAILKTENRVHGVATAASIWNTGVVGASVAQDRYLLAAMLAIMNLITLRYLLGVKKKLIAEAGESKEMD